MTTEDGKSDYEIIVRNHDVWRTSECINLMPSENFTSSVVRKLLSSDMGNRYTLPVNAEIHGVFMENAYRGTRFMDEIEEMAIHEAKRVFGAEYVNVRPMSGHIAAMSMLSVTCRRGDTIAATSSENGGYDGYMPQHMPNLLGLDVIFLPFNPEMFTLDTEEVCALIRRKKPRLVILGASLILFPYDLAIIRECCNDTGSYLGYDGSHVLGLIAGDRFQPDCLEFCDILVGSTHKTFFGPQGGIILSRSDDIRELFAEDLTWKTLDNAHWNRIAALGQALNEMRREGEKYADQVVRNARALGLALYEEELPVKYVDLGVTQSHQVLLSQAGMERKYDRSLPESAKILEESNIIVDSVGRLGTNEITRLGMTEEDMTEVAVLISRSLSGENVKDEVERLRQSLEIQYT